MSEQDVEAISPTTESDAGATALVIGQKEQRGRPFPAGQSGNPNGRPKGSRNRVTLAVEQLIHDRGEQVGKKALEKALDGDSTLLRALLATLVPPRRERTVEFELPDIRTTQDAAAASCAVLAALAGGDLSPSEANEVMALIATHVRTVEIAELEARVNAMEKRLPR
jgi:hypothetical protein